MISATYRFVMLFSLGEVTSTNISVLRVDLANLLTHVNPQTHRGGTVGIHEIGSLYCLNAVSLNKFDEDVLIKAIRLVYQGSEEVFFNWDNNDESAPGHFHFISIRTNIMSGGKNGVRESLQEKISEAADSVGLVPREGDSGYTDGVMTVVLQSCKPITQKQLDAVMEAIESVKDHNGDSYPVIMGGEPLFKMSMKNRVIDWLRWKLRGY